MLLTSITLQDIGTLEEIHAVLTEDGWVIPKWLIYLKQEIIKKEISIKQ